MIRDHDAGGEDDVGGGEKYDVATPPTSPMRDDVPVTRQEEELPMPTDHGTAFIRSSWTERYGGAKAIMGADLTEVMSKDVLLRESRDCQALLRAGVIEVYSSERFAELCSDFGLKPGE